VAVVIAVVGTIYVLTHLGGVWPRQVTVLYALDPRAVELDVDYVQAGEVVSSARFRPNDPTSAVIRHRVRLQPGAYEARITVYRADGRGEEQSRALLVPAEGPIRFDLTEATIASE